MFSLIITIISIALVVALVAATMYYGGSALNQGTVKADAAGFVTGAQQITTALVVHETDGNGTPYSLSTATGEFSFIDKLIEKNYLATIPVVKAAEVDLNGDPSTVATTWRLSADYNLPNAYILNPDTGMYDERLVRGVVLQVKVLSDDVCDKLHTDGSKGATLGIYDCNKKMGNVATFYLSKRIQPQG